MTLHIEFKNPEIKNAYDWQIIQEINVKNEDGLTIAKAEIELITLNKHREAIKSYNLLCESEDTDWEIPLNIYFKGQNLNAAYCELFDIKADTKKAKTHMMIEAISVLPAYRNKGVASYLLQQIAEHHSKVQSITIFSIPMKLFVDVEFCDGDENKAYYKSLNLDEETMNSNELGQCFKKLGFAQVEIDEAILVEPLPYEIFVATPQKLLANNL